MNKAPPNASDVALNRFEWTEHTHAGIAPSCILIFHDLIKPHPYKITDHRPKNTNMLLMFKFSYETSLHVHLIIFSNKTLLPWELQHRDEIPSINKSSHDSPQITFDLELDLNPCSTFRNS